MVFCVIVFQIVLSWSPINIKIFSMALPQSVIAHMPAFAVALVHEIVDESCHCGIISLEGNKRLFVIKGHEDIFNFKSGFGIVK